jgi:hypothetical protein
VRDGLFSMTQASWSFVKEVRPGMPLFLYDTSERRIHGVFEAVRLPTLALRITQDRIRATRFFSFFPDWFASARWVELRRVAS